MQNSRIAELLAGVAAAAFVVAGAAGPAHAGQVKYMGGHPIPGGGFCHIEAPHVHKYKPHKKKKRIKQLYRVHDSHYHFVGDPVAHGYDGPKYTYYGHHPIAVDVVAGVHAEGAPHHIEFCYLEGPHYHWYAPPADLAFTIKGKAFWYVGAYPPAYETHRDVYVGINAVYRPIGYARPVVTVAPPAAYVGPVLEVRAPVVEVGAPAVHVGGPHVRGEIRAGVEVHVPAPRLEVGVAVPGVVVVEEHHHHPPGRKVGWRKHKSKSTYKYKSRSKYKTGKKKKWKRTRRRH